MLAAAVHNGTSYHARAASTSSTSTTTPTATSSSAVPHPSPPSPYHAAGAGSMSGVSTLSPASDAPPLSVQDVKAWSNSDIAAWLQSLRLGTHIATFERNDITGAVLLDVDQAALKEMGITSVGDRIRVFTAIKNLKKRCLLAPSSSSSSSESTANLSPHASQLLVHQQPSPAHQLLQQQQHHHLRRPSAGHLAPGVSTPTSNSSRLGPVGGDIEYLDSSATRALHQQHQQQQQQQQHSAQPDRSSSPAAGVRRPLQSRPPPLHLAASSSSLSSSSSASMPPSNPSSSSTSTSSSTSATSAATTASGAMYDAAPKTPTGPAAMGSGIVNPAHGLGLRDPRVHGAGAQGRSPSAYDAAASGSALRKPPMQGRSGGANGSGAGGGGIGGAWSASTAAAMTGSGRPSTATASYGTSSMGGRYASSGGGAGGGGGSSSSSSSPTAAHFSTSHVRPSTADAVRYGTVAPGAASTLSQQRQHQQNGMSSQYASPQLYQQQSHPTSGSGSGSGAGYPPYQYAQTTGLTNPLTPITESSFSASTGSYPGSRSPTTPSAFGASTYGAPRAAPTPSSSSATRSGSLSSTPANPLAVTPHSSSSSHPPSLEDLKRRLIKFIGEDGTTRIVNVSDCRDAYDVLARVLKKFGKPLSAGVYTPTAGQELVAAANAAAAADEREDAQAGGSGGGGGELFGVFATSSDGYVKCLTDDELLAICHAPQTHDPLRERGLTLGRLSSRSDLGRHLPRRNKLEAFFGEKMTGSHAAAFVGGATGSPGRDRDVQDDVGAIGAGSGGLGPGGSVGVGGSGAGGQGASSGKKVNRASTMSIMSGLGVMTSKVGWNTHNHGSSSNHQAASSGSGKAAKAAAAAAAAAASSPIPHASASLSQELPPRSPSSVIPRRARNFFGQRPPSELISSHLADYFPTTEKRVLERTARRSIYGRPSSSIRSKRESTWSFNADPDAPPLPGKENVPRLGGGGGHDAASDYNEPPTIHIGFDTLVHDAHDGGAPPSSPWTPAAPHEYAAAPRAGADGHDGHLDDGEGAGGSKPPTLPPVSRASLDDWSMSLHDMGSSVDEDRSGVHPYQGLPPYAHQHHPPHPVALHGHRLPRPASTRRTSGESTRSRRSFATGGGGGSRSTRSGMVGSGGAHYGMGNAGFGGVGGSGGDGFGGGGGFAGGAGGVGGGGTSTRPGSTFTLDRSETASLLTVDEITQEVESRRESMQLGGGGGASGWVVDEDGVPIPIPAASGAARGAGAVGFGGGGPGSASASTRPSSGLSGSIHDDDSETDPDFEPRLRTAQPATTGAGAVGGGATLSRSSSAAASIADEAPASATRASSRSRSARASSTAGSPHLHPPASRSGILPAAPLDEAEPLGEGGGAVGALDTESKARMRGEDDAHMRDEGAALRVNDGVHLDGREEDGEDDDVDGDEYDDEDDAEDDEDEEFSDDDEDEGGGVYKSDHAAPGREPIKWIKGALIGAGSFGNVFLGMNARNGLLMAVKQVELPSGDTHSDQRKKSMLEALEREIELLKTLQHENIVQYLDSYADGTHLNIFLEYVPGGSVVAMLRNYGAFEEPLVKIFVKQILHGLSFLHNREIVHRDIKGANILVDNKGCVKISDFGISKKVESDLLVSARTHRPSLQGSVFWMAPEVVKQTSYTRKADIWSLGCLVVEMISGTHPWANLNQMQALFKIGSSAKPTLPDDISAECIDFLHRTFELDHNARPSADELLCHAFITAEYTGPVAATSVAAAGGGGGVSAAAPGGAGAASSATTTTTTGSSTGTASTHGSTAASTTSTSTSTWTGAAVKEGGTDELGTGAGASTTTTTAAAAAALADTATAASS